MDKENSSTARHSEISTEMADVYKRFGLDDEAEHEAGMNNVTRRCFSNIRRIVALYIEHLGLAAIDSLRWTTPRLVLNVPISNAIKILNERRLRNIFEIEFPDRPTDLRDRIVRSLGWDSGSSVYHLAVSTQLNEEADFFPSALYGPIEFSFDFDKLSKHATFTFGDCMNPYGIADIFHSLVDLNDGQDFISGLAVKRQILCRHAPLASAILWHTGSNHGHNYIDAQVPAFSLFDSLERVRLIFIPDDGEQYLLPDFISSLESLGIPLEIFGERRIYN